MQQHTEKLWPKFRYDDMVAFYGRPGENLTRIEFPYPMRLAWAKGSVVTTTVCNKKCAVALLDFLHGIYRLYDRDLDAIREAGLDLFGGIYSYDHRTIAGTSHISTHAWACAIDLNPDANRFGMQWPEQATMPLKVVEMFERFGGTAGARWERTPDAMHFEFTSGR